jgi:hypothetical protein
LYVQLERQCAEHGVIDVIDRRDQALLLTKR